MSAWAAARDAAGDALKPITELQASAVDLFDRMIRPDEATT